MIILSTLALACSIRISMLSITSMSLCRGPLGLVHAALLLVTVVRQTLDAATLRAMGALHLHLLNCHLILSPAGACDEILGLLLLLLLVALLQGLDSASRFGTSNESLLVERAI